MFVEREGIGWKEEGERDEMERMRMRERGDGEGEAARAVVSFGARKREEDYTKALTLGTSPKIKLD